MDTEKAIDTLASDLVEAALIAAQDCPSTPEYALGELAAELRSDIERRAKRLLAQRLGDPADCLRLFDGR